MLEPIELTAHPYCTDCLSWCVDGRLAVAAGEYVFILTPKYASGQREAIRRGYPKIRWDVVKLQVNQFSYAEWPRLGHQPLDSFSPGEELSSSHVTSLAWSSGGVGPFKRDVLAVQTSNHLLSVWGLEDGNLKWTRLAIVNQSLRAHFSPECSADEVLLQRRQRIRSFAWSPPCFMKPMHRESSLDKIDGWNYMAVANDNQEVIILRVNVAKRYTSKVQPLSTDVITSFKVHEFDTVELPRETMPGSMLFNILESNKCITDIAWGKWTGRTDGVYHSNIAVLHTDRVHMYRATTSLMKEMNLSPADKMVRTNNRPAPDQPHFNCWQFSVDREKEETLTGPLCWNSSGDSLYSPLNSMGFTVLEVRSSIEGYAVDALQWSDTCHDVSSPANKIIATNHICGAGRAVHAATHLGMIRTHISFTSEDHDVGDPVIRSIGMKHGEDLQRRIDAVRDRFDLDYDLGGKSTVRIWGLAKYRPRQRNRRNNDGGLPDEYMAACFTLHPAEMAEHSMPSAALMRVVISSTNDIDIDDGYISDDDRRPPRASTTYAYPPMNFIPIALMNDRSRQYTRLKILAYDNRWISADWATGLQSAQKDPLLRMIFYAHGCCCIMDMKPIEKITWRFDVLRKLTGIDFSDEISLGNEGPERRIIKAREIDSDIAALTFEKCTICGSPIPWNDPDSSQCQRGHVFQRCGITMLSVQDPRLSKKCMRCRKEFFDETKLLSLAPRQNLAEAVNNPGDSQNDQQGEPTASRQFSTSSDFVDFLMGEMFDVCPYCQGTYYVSNNELLTNVPTS